MFTNEEQAAVYKAIYNRRDIRSFLSKPILKDILRRILDAAHHAPSVGFMQPWSFIVISSQETKNSLAWAADKERRALAIHYEGGKENKFLSLKVEGLKEAPYTHLCYMRPDTGGLPCFREELHSGNRYPIHCLRHSKYVAGCLCGKDWQWDG